MFATFVTLPARAVTVIRRLVERGDDAPLHETEIHRKIAAIGSALPPQLLEALLTFRDGAAGDALCIRGLPTGAMADVPTPDDPINAPRTLLGLPQVGLGILGVLGLPFAYASQQSGRLVNNIAPMASRADTPHLGIGSGKPFDLHTEDAFMRHPPSYLQLACVRNPTKTPTSLSGFHETDVGDWLAPLWQPQYMVKTNLAQKLWGDHRLSAGPVVWGGGQRPYLRYNSVNTVAVPDAPQEAAHALDRLRRRLDDNMEDVVLEPGDVLIVNNYRLCHARRAFTAKFDGTDRWLMRAVAYRDPSVVASFIEDAPFPTLSPTAT
ncbi:TauD/TfdA family dioxygenase [Spongiactinospora sp. 9N601]|uniref:TauD/TfdA family dioxygenase n=1 Tax=Spongiactinospora sp. 9N601 TaxID=3375149 RepID=UPI0037A9C823